MEDFSNKVAAEQSKSIAKSLATPTRSLRKLEAGPDLPIFIVDNLLDASYVSSLYGFLCNLPFKLNDYDSEETQFVKHWKHEFSTSFDVSHPCHHLHGVVDGLIRELFPEWEGIENGRIHVNNHLFGDQQHEHMDSAPWHGVTAMYYANAEWNRIWMGETLFYGVSGEPEFVVSPKPGRIVIFPGHIVHRAGVPSRSAFVPRITIAFKYQACLKERLIPLDC